MITFRELELDDAELILGWRTSNRVTKFMRSDIDRDIEAQRRWLEEGFYKKSSYCWMIQCSGRDVGVLSLEDYDPDNKITSWGFYIGEDDALGVGGMVPPYFYNFAFHDLCVDRVRADVFYDNTNAVKLHLMHGYRFNPAEDYVIQKNGKDVLMISMLLEKEVFKESRFSRFRANFPTAKWEASGRG